MTFGEKLRKIRQDRGLTQAELAEMSNLSQPQICDYENGKSSAHPNNKIVLSMALGVKPSELNDDLETATHQE